MASIGRSASLHGWSKRGTGLWGKEEMKERMVLYKAAIQSVCINGVLGPELVLSSIIK